MVFLLYLSILLIDDAFWACLNIRSEWSMPKIYPLSPILSASFPAQEVVFSSDIYLVHSLAYLRKNQKLMSVGDMSFLVH